MTEGLGIFTLVTELLLILQCLQISFHQKTKIDKYTIGIIGADICIYMGINYGSVPTSASVLFYVLLWMYCSKEFGLTVGESAIRLMIGITMAGCIEVIIGYVVMRFVPLSVGHYGLCLSSVMGLVVTIILKDKMYLLEHETRKNRNMKVLGLVMLYGLFFCGLLIDYYVNQILINLYAVVILFVVVCIFSYLYKLEQIQKEMEMKSYELELQRIYGEAYEKLLIEVRRRQHDFKNQLGAIYSMHLTAGSFEELVKMQQSYGTILKENCKYDAILTGCENQILAGFLYYRCTSCENTDIDVIFDICIEQAMCKWAIHEIIEALGILIDNACESILEDEQNSKCIRLKVREEKKQISLEVANPARYISFAEIEQLFKYGYSSKGSGRGIGLARVLELVNKYQAQLRVHNQMYDEENWIVFEIEIDKQEGAGHI